MPVPMTAEELRTCRSAAERMENYEYRNPADHDDFISAALYRLFDGRHFRLIKASGTHSPLSGAHDVGEWLPTNEDVQGWKKF